MDATSQVTQVYRFCLERLVLLTGQFEIDFMYPYGMVMKDAIASYFLSSISRLQKHLPVNSWFKIG